MKKHFTISKLVLIALIAILPTTVFSQKADRYFYIMADGGISNFHGDLARYAFAPDFDHIKFNGHFGIGYQFGGVLGINAKIEMAGLEGEKNRKAFEPAVLKSYDHYGANLNLTFNMSNVFSPYKADRLFNVIPHVGIGQIHYRSEMYHKSDPDNVYKWGYENENEGDDNKPGDGIGDRRVVMTVPVGVELNFNLHPKWDVYADYTMVYTDTDYLDGQKNGEMEVKNDIFSTINLGVRYKFNKGSGTLKSMVKDFEDGKVTMKVTPEVLEEKGDKVPVTIEVNFPPKYFNKKAVMNFTPVLKCSDGTEVEFCTVNFKGEDVSGDGVMISHRNGGKYTYTCEVPYSENMNVSELVVEPLFYTHKTEIHPNRQVIKEKEKYIQADPTKLADGVINTSKRIANNSLNPTAAPNGYEKVTVLTGTGDIYFQVNQADLNWNLPLNKQSDNKAALAGMNNDVKNGYEVKDVTIEGWASPEGEETFNEGLSNRRAQAAAKYTKDELNKLARDKKVNTSFKNANDIVFNTKGNGPDWNGFMQAVEASNIKDKNAILNVIRSANAAKREQEIRNMISIYPELEKDILPALRRAIVNVNTFEPKHTDAELARLAIENPSELKCPELLYAATLTDNLNTQKTIYANAMRIYPNCENARINAAQVELKLGNTAAAKALLEQALRVNDKSAEIYNNLGIVAFYEGNYAEAEKNFNQAKALGADVNYNMGVLNIYKGDYATAASQMGNYDYDLYNLALAQTLNKDYSAAEKTLNRAPNTAEVNYLKAIVAARTNNTSKLYESLANAINMNAAYKTQAKNDREFIKFNNNAEFKALVD